MFCWPLFVQVDPATNGHVTDAPLLFILVLPMLVAIVLAQFAEGGMDAKALAMLGVLSAVNAPATAGRRTGRRRDRVLPAGDRRTGVRARLRFVLGCTSLFASR
jgi:energy-coupling factor transport system substrate-specific component